MLRNESRRLNDEQPFCTFHVTILLTTFRSQNGHFLSLKDRKMQFHLKPRALISDGAFIKFFYYFRAQISVYNNTLQQTIENEFRVAISAEKSVSQASTSAAATTTSTVHAESVLAPKDENMCLDAEQPMKPPRHKSKPNQPVETTIDNLDVGIDVSLASQRVDRKLTLYCYTLQRFHNNLSIQNYPTHHSEAHCKGTCMHINLFLKSILLQASFFAAAVKCSLFGNVKPWICSTVPLPI